MRGGGQRPAVVCLGRWQQVAVAEAKSRAESASAIAEAAVVMVAAAAAAAAGRRSGQDGVVRRQGSTTARPPQSLSGQFGARTTERR